MSHIRVKTTYEQMGSYGSTDIKTLYCHHNLSCDCVTFYNEDGSVADMFFEEWSSGKDKWNAMKRLWTPFKKENNRELEDGVEYYFTAPWEIKEQKQ